MTPNPVAERIDEADLHAIAGMMHSNRQLAEHLKRLTPAARKGVYDLLSTRVSVMLNGRVR
jgi:hypothetical protein